MSGIYIPGMEMPTRCLACQLNYDSCACILTGSRFYKYNTDFDPGEGRLSDCPLVPVPEHGRLIDADEFFKALTMDDCISILEAMHVQSILSEAPAIVPAEGGET